MRIWSEFAEEGLNKYDESQIRAMVGAPTQEEESKCICGKDIEKCEDAYSHMTQGF